MRSESLGKPHDAGELPSERIFQSATHSLKPDSYVHESKAPFICIKFTPRGKFTPMGKYLPHLVKYPYG